jgi:pimeloyl-ACP methyl ester carboxylesterase
MKTFFYMEAKACPRRAKFPSDVKYGPPLQATLLGGLPTAELTVFGDSSHMPHWEERDRYMTFVRQLAAQSRLSRRPD